MSVLDVYALLEPPIDPPPDVMALAMDGFTAMAAEVAAAPRLAEESLRAHDQVVRALSRRSRAILPVRFGSTVPDGETLARALNPRASQICAALAEVRDREQMTIRLKRGSSPDARAESPDDAAGPGTRYLERKRRAQEVPELDPLREELAPFIRAEKRERSMTAAWIASAFHLIDRGAAEVYTARARRLADSNGLAVAILGPSPPYAFAPEWNES